MSKFNPDQKLLISPEYFLPTSPLEKYEILFSHLNLSSIEENDPSKAGRPQISHRAIIRAFIYKNLRGLFSLSDLVADLSDYPSLASECGFDPSRSSPSVERFSSFLRETKNETLQGICKSLLLELIRLGEIKGKYLSIDSAPIKACVKENNPKTSCRDRFSKNKIPRGDKDSKLGIMLNYPDFSGKTLQYFWGYKNHVISDTKSELPLCETTKPANIHDSQMFIPLFRKIKNDFKFSPKGVIGDAAHDSQAIKEFIVKELKAKPFIARNPRRGVSSEFKLSSQGRRICIAGFEMTYWGKFKDRGKTRLKFVCPIIYRKKFAKEHPFCPWSHPKFLEGKGCTAYLVSDKGLRYYIDYASEEFKRIYNLRVSSERIFSRLLSVCMQNPSVKGLNAISNYATLSHITILAIALTAVKTGNKDKVRFVKSFIKNL